MPDFSFFITNNREKIANAIGFLEDSFGNEENHMVLASKISSHGNVIIAYNKNLLGYCALYTNDDVSKPAYISLTCVKKEYQNNHIGSRLLKASEEYALSRGMEKIKREVKKNSKYALLFYLNNGFTITGEASPDSIFLSKAMVAI